MSLRAREAWFRKLLLLELLRRRFGQGEEEHFPELRETHPIAEHYLREALADAHEIRAWMDAAYCVQALAASAGERDEQQRAARMLGAADAMLETAGPRFRAMATDDHELHQHAVSAAREQLGERAWTAAWEVGRAMTFDEAVASALEGEPLPSTP